MVRFDRIQARYEESHFRLDHSGTRVRGELLPDETPPPQPVSISRIALTPDIPIDRPSVRLGRSRKDGRSWIGLLILLVILILAMAAAAVTYGPRLISALLDREPISEPVKDSVNPL